VLLKNRSGFVPLLAFDKKGNRVGYGKSFMINFYPNVTLVVIKIGSLAD
jgi:5-formyltetrahydrofolate cyclo-ligase